MCSGRLLIAKTEKIKHIVVFKRSSTVTSYINVFSESVESQVLTTHAPCRHLILYNSQHWFQEHIRMRQCRNGCQELSVRIQTSRRRWGPMGFRETAGWSDFMGLKVKNRSTSWRDDYRIQLLSAVHMKVLTVVDEN